MKKLITPAVISLLLVAFVTAKAQNVVFSSDFESWTGNTPDNWVGIKNTLSADSISPYTASAHSPATSVRLRNGGSAHKRFTTKAVSITNGTVYYLSYWVRGHGNIRIGLYDGRATGSGYATYHNYDTINSLNWVQYTDTITCRNTISTGEFIFSVQLTVNDIDGLQLDDVTITDGPGSATPVISIISPAENSISYSSSVNINFNVVNFIVGNPGPGIDGHINYFVDGGNAVMQFTVAPIALTGLTAGNHTVITQLVDTANAPLIPDVADTVHFSVNLSLPNQLTIYDIQYTTDALGNSPWKDSVVTVSGIVTGAGSQGYFIQDGSGAWNGIYVFDNANKPATGDSITITATVDEYFNFTELKNVLGYNLNSSGNTLPAPVTVTGAQIKPSAGEQYEGVLVKIMNAKNLVSAPTYSEWKLNDATVDSIKSHQLLSTYTLILNQTYNLTGPVYFSYGEYKIEPRDVNDIQVGITEMFNETTVALYPNPASSVICIESGETGAPNICRVYDIPGTEVITKTFSDNKINLDVSKLNAGLYFVRIEGKAGVAIKKFIKE